jgi:hypothetical protein
MMLSLQRIQVSGNGERNSFNVIGAADCTYCGIQSPCNDPMLYLDPKELETLNLKSSMKLV